MTPSEFLNLLWQNKPSDLHILIWTLQEKRSQWCRDVEQAAEFVNANRTDVYVGVGLSRQDYGPRRRCPSIEIAGIPGFGVDLDVKSEAHPKELPPSIEDALTLIPESLPPTIVVATGNGIQAWWLFKEPWIFESDNDRKEAQILSSRFQTLLRYRSSQRGWAFDRLSDLARVLRIPGTVNGKDSQTPKRVAVHSFGQYRYNPSEIEDFLDELSVPDPAAAQGATKHWAEGFADVPPVINMNARFPQERIDQWLATDLRFKNTWFRQRHDLNDQSQSGYDMALADFGVSVGLSPQAIIDLITYHRGLHKVKKRTTIAYFKRTISKAEKVRSPNLASTLTQIDAPNAAETNQAAPPTGEDGESPPAPDPEIVKAKNWERISGVLGFKVFRLIKITGTEPVYRLEAEGGKITFSNIRKLSSQEIFRRTIAGAINKFPQKLRSKLWDEIAQLMLDSLTEEDGGEEMQLEGAGHIYISQYLSETGFIESVQGQSKQNARKPLILEGSITICSNELHLHIVRAAGQNVSIQQVVAMLSALAAKSFRHHPKGVDQTRWRLPATEFDPAEYSAHYREDIEHGDSSRPRES